MPKSRQSQQLHKSQPFVRRRDYRQTYSQVMTTQPDQLPREIQVETADLRNSLGESSQNEPYRSCERVQQQYQIIKRLNELQEGQIKILSQLSQLSRLPEQIQALQYTIQQLQQKYHVQEPDIHLSIPQTHVDHAVFEPVHPSSVSSIQKKPLRGTETSPIFPLRLNTAVLHSQQNQPKHLSTKQKRLSESIPQSPSQSPPQSQSSFPNFPSHSTIFPDIPPPNKKKVIPTDFDREIDPVAAFHSLAPRICFSPNAHFQPNSHSSPPHSPMLLQTQNTQIAHNTQKSHLNPLQQLSPQRSNGFVMNFSDSASTGTNTSTHSTETSSLDSMDQLRTIEKYSDMSGLESDDDLALDDLRHHYEEEEHSEFESESSCNSELDSDSDSDSDSDPLLDYGSFLVNTSQNQKSQVWQETPHKTTPQAMNSAPSMSISSVPFLGPSVLSPTSYKSRQHKGPNVLFSPSHALTHPASILPRMAPIYPLTSSALPIASENGMTFVRQKMHKATTQKREEKKEKKERRKKGKKLKKNSKKNPKKQAKQSLGEMDANESTSWLAEQAIVSQQNTSPITSFYPYSSPLPAPNVPLSQTSIATFISPTTSSISSISPPKPQLAYETSPNFFPDPRLNSGEESLIRKHASVYLSPSLSTRHTTHHSNHHLNHHQMGLHSNLSNGLPHSDSQPLSSHPLSRMTRHSFQNPTSIQSINSPLVHDFDWSDETVSESESDSDSESESESTCQTAKQPRKQVRKHSRERRKLQRKLKFLKKQLKKAQNMGKAKAKGKGKEKVEKTEKNPSKYKRKRETDQVNVRDFNEKSLQPLTYSPPFPLPLPIFTAQLPEPEQTYEAFEHAVKTYAKVVTSPSLLRSQKPKFQSSSILFSQTARSTFDDFISQDTSSNQPNVPKEESQPHSQPHSDSSEEESNLEFVTQTRAMLSMLQSMVSSPRPSYTNCVNCEDGETCATCADCANETRSVEKDGSQADHLENSDFSNFSNFAGNNELDKDNPSPSMSFSSFQNQHELQDLKDLKDTQNTQIRTQEPDISNPVTSGIQTTASETSFLPSRVRFAPETVDINYSEPTLGRSTMSWIPDNTLPNGERTGSHPISSDEDRLQHEHPEDEDVCDPVPDLETEFNEFLDSNDSICAEEQTNTPQRDQESEPMEANK